MNQKRTYKTNLCRHFIAKGYCSLLDKCHFAHGKHELRNRDDPEPIHVPPTCKPISIYKTQLCKYFMNGYCRNQSHCPFAHGAIDLRGMVIMTEKPPEPNIMQAAQFLHSIIRNLEQVFPDDLQKKVLINKGLELIEQKELEEANNIINELMSSKNLDEEQKEQCQTILNNAYSLHKINNSLLPF